MPTVNVQLQSAIKVSFTSSDGSDEFTVNPFDNVVLSVVSPWLIGVAKPLVRGCTDLRAALLRRAWFRRRASCCEVMFLWCRGEENTIDLNDETQSL